MNNSLFRLNQVAASLFALCLCTFISGCSCRSSTESEETEEIEEVEEFTADGYVNGHGYVDLGLSVKWATCNIGAESPSDYGAYCAINYHPSKLKNVHLLYDSANDIEAINNMVKDSEGRRNAITAGDCTYEYDGGDLLNVALFADCEDVQEYWGDQWRLPTGSEMKELFYQCIWEYTEQGGSRGYEVIGPNGNSIFLPTTGYFDGWSSPNDAESYGYYLSGIRYSEPRLIPTQIPSIMKITVTGTNVNVHFNSVNYNELQLFFVKDPDNPFPYPRWVVHPDAESGLHTLDGFAPKFPPSNQSRLIQNDTTFLYTFQFNWGGRCLSAWTCPEILLPIRPVSE